MWQRLFFRSVVFRDNLFFLLMKKFLALNTFLGKTVFVSFRFSDFVIGLPPASVKEEKINRVLFYVTCFVLSGLRMENHAT